MGKRKKNDKVDVSSKTPATHNPFAAALAGLSAPDAPPAPAAEATEPPEGASPSPRIRTRVERKGRGGKTVTIVEGLESVRPHELEALARSLRKALGTGATVEEGTIVAQGDVRERVETWYANEAGDGDV